MPPFKTSPATAPTQESGVESPENRREKFVKENNDKLLSLSLQEMVDLDNITRRENGAPLVETPSITLQEGEYANNNGVTIICVKRALGGGDYKLTMRASDASLQEAGFKQVSHYVPFSNGVNKARVPLVGGFMEEQLDALHSERSAQDAKYAVS